MEPKDFEGRIICIIPVRNEGVEIVRTIRDLRASKAEGTDLHFAVVDDASNDKCCDILSNARDITVFVNKEPRGQGVARTLGVTMFRGADAYVSLDAHMRMETKFGLETLALDAQETGGIVGCLSGNLANGKNFYGAGSKWHNSTEGGIMNFASNWCYGRPQDNPPRLQEAQLLSGQCYVFTEATFDKLGGFGESHGLYGFFERDLSINAYFKGIPVNVNTQVQSWHWYRRNRPYHQTGQYRWWGYIQCLRSMFRPDIWERYFLPAAQKAVTSNKDVLMLYLMYDPHLAAIQRDYEPHKVRTDEEVLEWMGVDVAESE